MHRINQGLLAAGFMGGVSIGAVMMLVVPDPVPDATLTAASVGSRADAVLLPFEPPILTPLRYEFRLRIERDSGIQSAESIDELMFLPAPAGRHALRWRTRSFSVEAAPSAKPLLVRGLLLRAEAPLLIGISAQGVPTGVLNEPALRQTSDRLIDASLAAADRELANVPIERRTAIRQTIAQIATLQRLQSPEAFAEAVLENPRLLLRDLGPLVPGRPVVTATEQASKIDGGRVRFRTETRLRRHVPGVSAEVVITAVADADDARRTMEAMIGPILAAIPDPQQRAAARTRIAEMGEPSISEETLIEIALPSGLTRQLTWRKQLFIPGRGTMSETRSFRLLS